MIGFKEHLPHGFIKRGENARDSNTVLMRTFECVQNYGTFHLDQRIEGSTY